METKPTVPTTVDQYIAQFPADIQQILFRLRALVREEAPQAEERIGYQMPGYYLNGPLVYFAAFKRHIGLYPTPPTSRLSTRSLPPTSAPRAPCNSPWTGPFPTT